MWACIKICVVFPASPLLRKGFTERVEMHRDKHCLLNRIGLKDKLDEISSHVY